MRAWGRLRVLVGNPRIVCIGIATTSAVLLVAAFAFQYLGGLAPCPLCVYQRWAHAGIVLVSVPAIILHRGRFAPLLAVLPGIACLVSAGIAGYHVGVEEALITTGTCDPDIGSATTIAELLEQLDSAVPCGRVPWSMFGISMAGYNSIISLILALFAFTSAGLSARSITGVKQ